MGEAPGHNEDLQGIPFVGLSGQLFSRLLERAGIPSREHYFITNILKCRPPGNRDPESEEIRACWPFLQNQIAEIKPKVILTVGKFASCSLTLQFGTMSALLAKQNLVHLTPDGNEIPVIPIYHPSYLLRQGKSLKAKELAKDTVKRLQQALAITRSER